MATLGKFCLGIALGIFYTFVAWKLWWWFAVPLGAPHIGFMWGWGLYLLGTSILLWSATPAGKEYDSEIVVLALSKGLLAAIALLEGWVVHLVAGPIA